MPRFRKHIHNLTALVALASSLWLFSHELIPVNVSPDEPIIPVSDAVGKIGFITQRGQVVSAFRWDRTDGYDTQGMAAVSKLGKLGWIDRKGTVVIPLQWGIPEEKIKSNVPHTLLVNKGFDSRGWASVGKNGKFGWIDRLGRKVLPFVWQDETAFDANDLAIVMRKEKFGWINREGNIVLPLEWDEVASFDSTGMARVKRNRFWGCINQQGKAVLPLEWDWISEFDSNDMAVAIKNLKYGWINRHGSVIVPVVWSCENMAPFDDQGMARVRGDDKHWGWINRRGTAIIPLEWGDTFDFDDQGMARVRRDRHWGWINREGKVLVEPVWESAGDYDSRGMARVFNGAGWGWINRRGEVVIPCQFRMTTDFDRHDGSWVLGEGKEVRIDRAGKQIKGVANSWGTGEIDERSGLRIVGQYDDIQGCLGQTGQWIVPLDRWQSVSIESAHTREIKERFWIITASRQEQSILTKAWGKMSNWQPFFKKGAQQVSTARFCVLYDSVANRVIWTSKDCLREIWWGSGLAVGAAGAWLWGRRGRKGALTEPSLPPENHGRTLGA